MFIKCLLSNIIRSCLYKKDSPSSPKAASPALLKPCIANLYSLSKIESNKEARLRDSGEIAVSRISLRTFIIYSSIWLSLNCFLLSLKAFLVLRSFSKNYLLSMGAKTLYKALNAVDRWSSRGNSFWRYTTPRPSKIALCICSSKRRAIGWGCRPP